MAVQGAYLAGDLGPGGEDVLRRKLLEHQSGTPPQGHVHSSSGASANESIQAESNIAASHAGSGASESVAYTEEFESDAAGVTHGDSIMEEDVGEQPGGGSYTVDSIDDEVDGSRGDVSRQQEGPASGGSTREEAQLAELTRRSAALERQRRQLAIEAEKARIAQMEADIARMSQGGQANLPAVRRPPTGRAAAPKVRRATDLYRLSGCHGPSYCDE